jgi:hypothetical protein
MEALLFTTVTIGGLALLAALGIFLWSMWAGCLILFQGGRDLASRSAPYINKWLTRKPKPDYKNDPAAFVRDFRFLAPDQWQIDMLAKFADCKDPGIRRRVQLEMERLMNPPLVAPQASQTQVSILPGEVTYTLPPCWECRDYGSCEVHPAGPRDYYK